MSYYNPYMKGPDMSQGINDFVGKLMQMMMMKQLFGQQGGVPGQGGGPLGQAGGQVGSPQMQGQAQGGGPPPGVGGGQMMPPPGPQMNAQAQAGGPMPMTDPNKDLKISPDLLKMFMMMFSPNKMMGGGLG